MVCEAFSGEGRQPKLYVDLHQKQIDHDSKKRIEELCNEIIPSQIEKSNTFKYEIDWLGISGQNMEAYDTYMMNFVVDFYKSVIRQIDKSMKRKDDSFRGNMAKEIHKHMDICVIRSKEFLGREEDLYKVKSYLGGGLNRSFVVCGQVGCGKTSFVAKLATSAESWMSQKIKKQNLQLQVVVRFIGTTPISSSVHELVLSICQQICYNLEIPIEEIPKDFVPLTNYFKILLDKASKGFFTIILLDSIEAFFVDSHQNGATSWIPKCLPDNVKIIITFTKDQERSVGETNKFLQGFTEGVTNDENILEIDELGPFLSEKILRSWMGKIDRTLTNQQWRLVLNAFEVCTLPLFLKLIFSEIRKWKSYWIPSSTVIPSDITTTIIDLFDTAEDKFGQLLVSHAVSYITASKGGLSESELEDILSLDEAVLQEVFQFSVPSVRRIPPIMWRKIRRYLTDNFAEREANGTRVIVWAHKQFREVAIQKYMKDNSLPKNLHSIMADYFMGIWANGKSKPFKITELHRQRFKVKGRLGEADRKVPTQPNVFLGADGKISRYNLRKFGELPFHLIRSGRILDLCDHVLFNYHWLHAKISAVPIEDIIGDFELSLEVVSDHNYMGSGNFSTHGLIRQITLVLGALRLSRLALDRLPDMLAPVMIGRLIPEMHKHEYIKSLLEQCDSEGFIHNCLIPIKSYLPCPGGPLKYALEGHRFAVFSCCLTMDKRYVVSVSNKFISWDVSSSEICRDIDPRADGIMLSMVLTNDSRFAVAFTNTNQLIIVDIMLGSFLKVEKPMSENDDIVDLAIANLSPQGLNKGHCVVVYNNRYFRTFDMEGNHLGEEQFSVALTSVLSIHFYDYDKVITGAGDPTQSYLSVHWSGDTDLEDTRLWVRVCINRMGLKNVSEILVYNAFELVCFDNKEVIFFACKKSESVVQAMLEGSPDYKSKWDVVRFHLDPKGDRAAISQTLCSEIQEEILGLKFHSTEANETSQSLPEILTIATPSGFVVIFTPMEDNVKKRTLRLPRSVNNIRVKLNQSNPVVVGWRGNQMGRLNNGNMFIIAGIRKDIFVWDVDKELPLRSFVAHSSRILQMQALNQKDANVFITSSIDKTIKVWDMNELLQLVHPVDKMDHSIKKLIYCPQLNKVLAVTRCGLGFWSLESGNLEAIVADSPMGGFITDVILTSDGKYFLTAESGYVRVWNVRHKVVLQKIQQNSVVQLLEINNGKSDVHVAAISVVKATKFDHCILKLICRNVVDGSTAYQFELPVSLTVRFDTILSGDGVYILNYGLEKQKAREVIHVHSAKKGTLVHKVPIRYPQLKRPTKFLPYEDHCIALVDSEKSNIIDIKAKIFVKSVRKWTGQSTKDGKFGLSSPNGGGLLHLDLSRGCVHKTLLSNTDNGVFRVLAQFSACEKYILYYHEFRQTVMLLRAENGRCLSNFLIPSQATCFITTPDGMRLIVGGEDGSVVILVIAALEEDYHVLPEAKEKMGRYLNTLPSRRVKRSQDSSTDSLHQKLTTEKRINIRRRFRAVVRIALYMEKLIRHFNAKRGMIDRGPKSPRTSRKQHSPTSCPIS